MRQRKPRAPLQPVTQMLLFTSMACIGGAAAMAFGVIRLNTVSLQASLPFWPTWPPITWLVAGLLIAIPMTALAALRTMLWLIDDQRYRILDLGQIDRMEGLHFEHYVARLLRHLGYRTHVTPGSKDYGVDVVAERAGERFAIQVKRYKSKVSRRAVSDAVGAMKHYNCNRCMVVTNSYYTDDAYLLAHANDCILVDRDELAQWISAYKTGSSGAWAMKNLFAYGASVANGFVLFLTFVTLYSMLSFLLPHTSILGFSLANGQSARVNTPIAPTPVLASGPVSANIERVWVEPNASENGVRGLYIHARFNIDNAKGIPHLLVLTFSDANRKPARITIERSFQPETDPQLYADSLVFVPLDQINPALTKIQNKYTGYVKAQIIQASDRHVLAQSGEVAVTGN